MWKLKRSYMFVHSCVLTLEKDHTSVLNLNVAKHLHVRTNSLGIWMCIVIKNRKSRFHENHLCIYGFLYLFFVYLYISELLLTYVFSSVTADVLVRIGVENVIESNFYWHSFSLFVSGAEKKKSRRCWLWDEGRTFGYEVDMDSSGYIGCQWVVM